MELSFKGLLAAVTVVGVAGAGVINLSLDSRSYASTAVTGELRVPDDYRSHYEHLGSWSVADEAPRRGAQAIHDVYASPGTIAAYVATGDFPDGTVLVKEVWQAATEDMTTGTVSRGSVLAGWFVMVRDAGNTHSGDDLWGDGWGWAWFDAGDRTTTTSSSYASDCQACHIPASATHRVYTQGYPVLSR